MSKCRFYISNTAVENSSNASSEGVFLSQESYISDIPPHRELLAGIPYTIESIPNVAKPMIKVVSKDLNSSVLKSWDEVISSMVTCVSDKLSRQTCRINI